MYFGTLWRLRAWLALAGAATFFREEKKFGSRCCQSLPIRRQFRIRGRADQKLKRFDVGSAVALFLHDGELGRAGLGGSGKG